MFRTAIASAVFLGTVVFGATTSRADGIAIDTNTCNQGQIDELRLGFEHAKRVIDAIVPSDYYGDDFGNLDDWDSPYINNGESGAYRMWFGEPNDYLVSEVKDTLMKISLALRDPIIELPYEYGGAYPPNIDVVFRCDTSPVSPPACYRFSFGSGVSSPNVEDIRFPRFTDSDVPLFAYSGVDEDDIAGFSSKVGVLIHELAHRMDGLIDISRHGVCDNDGYDDEDCTRTNGACYWEQECLDLAAYPDDAIENPENYEKFTMYVYMHVMAAQFVAATHSLMY